MSPCDCVRIETHFVAKGVGRLLAWLLITLSLDLVTKEIILRWMAEGTTRPLISGVFHLTHVQNPGVSFGLFPDGTLWFGLIGLVFTLLLIVWYYRWGKELPWGYLATGLLAGGALGNVWDRLFRGYVIDFLDFRVWPVFNVADIAIVVGCGLIFWGIVRTEMK